MDRPRFIDAAASAAAALASILTVTFSTPAPAAEIIGWFAGAVQPVAQALIPQFEAATGNKVTATFGLVGPIMDRVAKGDVGDLIIVAASDIAELQKTEKIIAGTATAIAKTGIGVAVRAGAAKPDVSTPEAFKQALLSAKTIGLADPNGGASSSKQTMNIFERMGIEKEVLAKAKLVGGGTKLIQALKDGTDDLVVYLASEISHAPGIDFVGPVPSEFQFDVAYSGAVLKVSPNPVPAKAFLDFLVGPSALPVIRANGLRPG